MEWNSSCRRCRCFIYFAAAVTSTLLLPSRPHCRCRPTRLQHATLILHLLQSYPQNQSKCILLPPMAQSHPKFIKKIAPNAPEVTGIVFLHPPVSSNAIGVLKCTLFVSLIIQVSHCIFNFLYKVDTTHDILFCSNPYPRTRPTD